MAGYNAVIRGGKWLAGSSDKPYLGLKIFSFKEIVILYRFSIKNLAGIHTFARVLRNFTIRIFLLHRSCAPCQKVKHNSELLTRNLFEIRERSHIRPPIFGIFALLRVTFFLAPLPNGLNWSPHSKAYAV